MVKIGKSYNKKVICTLSDMNIPLGRNIGNALEVREAMDFFAGKHDKRLYELSVYISSLMISSAKNISFRRAKSIVLNLLENGYAKTKFYQWIKYQGGDLTKLKEKAKKYIVVSDKTGYVNSIDSNIIAKLVFDLGAGRKKKTDSIDYACGVILNKQLGEKVNKGEILGIIYYNKKVEDMENIFKDAFNIEKRKRQVKKIIISTVK
jgi:pyrimidine-nucleoside phosphorylase